MPTSALGVTQLLAHWRDGDAAALAQLMTLLYQELRSMAHEHVHRERRDHTLQGTALVNEAFVRLIHLESVSMKDRAHFFAVASSPSLDTETEPSFGIQAEMPAILEKQ